MPRLLLITLLILPVSFGCGSAQDKKMGSTQAAQRTDNPLYAGVYRDFLGWSPEGGKLRIDKVLARGTTRLYGGVIDSKTLGAASGKSLAIGSIGHQFQSNSQQPVSFGAVQLSFHSIVDASGELVSIGKPKWINELVTGETRLPFG